MKSKKINRVFLLLSAFILFYGNLRSQNAWELPVEYTSDNSFVADTIFPLPATRIDTFPDLESIYSNLTDPVLFDSINGNKIFLVRSGTNNFDYHLLIKKNESWIKIELIAFHSAAPPQLESSQVDGKGMKEIIISGIFKNENNSDDASVSKSISETHQLVQIWNPDQLTCMLSQVTNVHQENISRDYDKNPTSDQVVNSSKGNSFDQDLQLKILKKKLEMNINWRKNFVDLIKNENLTKSQQVKIVYTWKKNYWLRTSAAMISSF